MGSINNGAFNWSNPEFDTSPFHKWEKEGDSIEGVILDITSHTFPPKDGEAAQTYPVLHLDTVNGPKELTVSGVDLLSKTKAKDPQVGDHYSAAWIGTAGKKRIFLVNLVKGHVFEAMAPKAPNVSTTATGASEQVPF